MGIKLRNALSTNAKSLPKRDCLNRMRPHRPNIRVKNSGNATGEVTPISQPASAGPPQHHAMQHQQRRVAGENIVMPR